LPDEDAFFSKPKFSHLKEKCKLSHEEAEDFANKCAEDMETVNKLLQLVPEDDEKFKAFFERISEISPHFMDSVQNNGLIVFSQYAATARYLYENLRKSGLTHTVRLVTGEACYDERGNSVDKVDAVKAFQRTGGILVSTDVLSEGQNLQNAQYVVNYDFPWNPVVLTQRVGRVDRMRSLHEKIFLINILPRNGDPDDPRSLEHFLRLMKKLYARLEAIRETIGLDASTLGEQAAPKDFGLQEALARNDVKVLEILNKQLEQFTSDPKDTLAKMINDKGLEWIKELPTGIGAYKHGSRDGLFILFSDSNDYYWRLKYFDGKKELVTSPKEIVDAIMEGEVQNSGEVIKYGILIERMKRLKHDLRKELEDRLRRDSTLQGVPPRATRAIREIYNELAISQEPDGETLAVLFREMAGRQGVVNALQQARREGRLIQKARELLKKQNAREDPNKPESEKKLTRVCWCWIQPRNRTG